ncbi:MAG: XRE family transcriptional regulator [Methylococcaceae bacterium]|nr:MAG: XRE family transcriptional regulator [Methylococcaceae bacterium]
MEGFGKRLKEERERLGLSQAKFAEACGVGKTAQYTYEKGARQPDFSYLDAAEKLGVDTEYVMRGTKKGSDWLYARAYKRVLDSMETFLELEKDRLENIAMLAGKCDETLNASVPLNSYGYYNMAVLDWLRTSKKPESCIDLDLFTNTLTELEAAIAKTGQTLAPEKKASATVLLYRAFKACGKIDEKMIEDAISLAT